MYYYLFEPQRGPKDFERTAQIKELLSSLGIAGEMASPTPGKGVEELVATAIAKRYSTIIAVGGIDLVNRTAHALESYDAVFGIIPTTEHPDITRLIGVSDWKSAAEQLKRRRFQSVRMGSMNGTSYFLTPATIEVASKTGFRVSSDTFSISGQGGLISVMPTTAGEEAVLQVIIQPLNQKKSGFLQNLFGKKTEAPRESRLYLPSFEVSTDSAVSVIVAGTAITGTPVRFGVQEKDLRIIVGKGTENA